MADPLSITASIVAVVGAAGGITKTLAKIKNIRNAPDELLALINEVSDLRLILNDLQHYITQDTQRQQILQEELQHISILVGRAKDKLLQLDELIQYRLVKPESISDEIKTAVTTRKIKACEFLLKAGADPYLEIFGGGGSAFDYIWNIIFAASGDQAGLETLRNLFPDKDNSLEERQFPTLHKTVLNITSRRLEEELTSCGSDIDRIDSDGNTALMWAARRGDSIAVDLLLKANADPNLVNRLYMSPLLYAARRSDPTCTKLLLKAGADPHHVNDRNFNALHYAAENQNGREMIECLVEAGVDVNKRTIWGCTPLSHAAFQDSTISAEALLDYGADLNVLDCERDTPLTDFIRNHADNTTELLLHRGATYLKSNVYGNTILHQAARSGGSRTLSILQAAELKSIDPDATNNKGKTAIQIAREREVKPHGFIAQFQNLLAGIRERNASQEASSTDGSNPVNSQSTSGDRAYLRYLAKWVRQLWAGSIYQRSGSSWSLRISTAILHPWIGWGPRVFWAYWVLGLCFAGLAYLFLNFGVMRRLGMVWDILGPGGFKEV
ncbi:MAG: hypothetical protein Q9187_002285 [Circinaria calcarea]